MILKSQQQYYTLQLVNTDSEIHQPRKDTTKLPRIRNSLLLHQQSRIEVVQLLTER